MDEQLTVYEVSDDLWFSEGDTLRYAACDLDDLKSQLYEGHSFKWARIAGEPAKVWRLRPE